MVSRKNNAIKKSVSNASNLDKEASSPSSSQLLLGSKGRSSPMPLQTSPYLLGLGIDAPSETVFDSKSGSSGSGLMTQIPPNAQTFSATYNGAIPSDFFPQPFGVPVSQFRHYSSREVGGNTEFHFLI